MKPAMRGIALSEASSESVGARSALVDCYAGRGLIAWSMESTQASPLRKNAFLVKEHVGMFKAANNFDIFDPEATIDVAEICTRATQACFLVPGMKVTVVDKRTAGGAESHW